MEILVFRLSISRQIPFVLQQRLAMICVLSGVVFIRPKMRFSPAQLRRFPVALGHSLVAASPAQLRRLANARQHISLLANIVLSRKLETRGLDL